MQREALRQCERNASEGDVEAAYLAGCARHDDDDLSLRALDRALRWLRLAAEAGHARAARRLGYIHIVDLQDIPAGVHWYTHAAEAGDAAAASSLGHLHCDRWRHPALLDLPRAERWLSFALANGQPHAGRQLGLLLLGRERSADDHHRGARLLSDASALSCLDAWHRLRLHRRQHLVAPVGWRLVRVPEAPSFPLVPTTDPLHPECSDDALHALARVGDPEANFELALRLTNARSPGPDTQAFSAAWTHFHHAARHHVARAAPWLAVLALSEPGVPHMVDALAALDHAVATDLPDAAAGRAWFDQWLRLEVWVAPAPAVEFSRVAGSS